MSKKLVIGVGNRYRGDDAAGCIVADHLQTITERGFDVVVSDGDVGELLEWFQSYDEVFIVDAMNPLGDTKSFMRWDATLAKVPSVLSGASSHVLGVAQAVELARALAKLPRRLVIFGVAGRDFGMKEGLSADTTRGVADVVEQVRQELTGGT